MTELEERYADLPARMRRLPIDAAGRPVPRFVEFVDGKPDFRIMDAKHLVRAARNRLCWVCGDGLGRYLTFTTGPMCLINMVSAEPPSHHECALYSATHCPFLINPERERRENNLPEDHRPSGGEMIARNPGVTALITCLRYSIRRAGHGVLFDLGEPDQVEFFAEGRPATRAEVQHSIDTGLPILRQADAGTKWQDAAWAGIDRRLAETARWLPADNVAVG